MSSSALPSRVAPLRHVESVGRLVTAFGGRCYCIEDVDRLPPFFLTLASASDLWAFLGSNGSVVAGRGDADHALFAYQAVDRIYDSVSHTGSLAAIDVETDTGRRLWLPFAPRAQPDPAARRHLYKSVEGDRVWFEEVNTALGLAYRCGWVTAAAHGVVRECELVNLGARDVRLRLLDGVRNLQPAGIPRRLQETSSCLADAYKTAEVLPGSTLAVFSLSAGIVDQPVARECLRANIVWSDGLAGATPLLAEDGVRDWFEGREPAGPSRRRGVRCHYLLSASLHLAPHRMERWFLVADAALDHTAIVQRHAALRSGRAAQALRSDIAATASELCRLVGDADGLQGGGDEVFAAHHFANVLFNVMRGGTFADGGRIRREEFARHLARHNRPAAARHQRWIAALPEEFARSTLLARAAAAADPVLERLAAEYLPLFFSRRHGDPSRPWNRFRIRLRDEHGRRRLGYEGNWRDIFQNWEALGWSFPEYFEAAAIRFLNASTLDGYNPYRLSDAGLDWETPDPEDPWASIGYWGDHQVIYLLKLLECAERFQPGGLLADPRAPRFAYADVPYRIASFGQMRRDPHATIAFRHDLHERIVAREGELGADARLRSGPGGDIVHVSLVEKLLVLILTRLSNFVPGGGIWMNTQRPEWNDANNALVGHGVSVVTLAYLRRMLVFCRRRWAEQLGAGPVTVSGAVAVWLHAVTEALERHAALLRQNTLSAAERFALLSALAEAGTRYREQAYASGPGAPDPVSTATLLRLLDLALRFVEHSLQLNRRADGLFHSYNLIAFAPDGDALHLQHLDLMLEGQVAILSSGLLSPREAAALLAALRDSALYRADQASYLLYPDREYPAFVDRNVVPTSAADSCPLLGRLLAAGHTGLIRRDADGRLRFAPDLVNHATLDCRLDELAADPVWQAAIADQRDGVHAAYEATFHHHAFTGRSGTMFGYEGLGCIYWHMVAKLLVAVQENFLAARAAGAAEAEELAQRYHEVRAGLGFNKTPAEFGAVPTDPYSHTPGHSGAQQPGMTGQVKEEILARWGELGISVHEGIVAFDPALLRAAEFTDAPAFLPTISGAVPLPTGSLGFHFCGVPVIYRLGGPGATRIVLHVADGTRREIPGCRLDRELSAALLGRRGAIGRIEVMLGGDYRPRD